MLELDVSYLSKNATRKYINFDSVALIFSIRLRKYMAEGVHLTIFFLSSVSLSLMGNGVQKLDAFKGDPGPFNFWINENQLC